MIEPPQPGVQRCMTCRWLFVSPDPERIRRCKDCKDQDDVYSPPSGTVVILTEAVVDILRDPQ